jgi:hypothetical protein
LPIRLGVVCRRLVAFDIEPARSSVSAVKHPSKAISASF